MKSHNNGSNMKHNRQNNNNGSNASGGNTQTTSQSAHQANKEGGSNLQVNTSTANDLAVINKLAKDATPKQMMLWIERLQELYEQKKTDVRKDLKDKVGELLESNGYTVEELFGARQLPSTADLAARSRTRSKDNGKARLM